MSARGQCRRGHEMALWVTYKVLGGVFGENTQFKHKKYTKQHAAGKLGGVNSITFQNGKYELELDQRGFFGPPRTDFVPTFLKNIESIEQVDEEKTTDIKSAVGWGIVGGLATGGIGLLAGALIAGRNKKYVTFEIRFKDGTYFICQCRKHEYAKLMADAGMSYTKMKSIEEDKPALLE